MKDFKYSILYNLEYFYFKLLTNIGCYLCHRAFKAIETSNKFDKFFDKRFPSADGTHLKTFVVEKVAIK